MLAVSLSTNNNDGHKREAEAAMEANFPIGGDEFCDFSGGNLLDSIDFDDIFMGMQDSDVLPDLEMDPELLAEFSFSGGEESEANNSSVEDNNPNDDGHVGLGGIEEGEANNSNGEGVEGNKKRENMEGAWKGGEKRKAPEEQIESKKDQESECTTTANSSFKEGEKGKKSSSSHTKGNNNNNNNQGKRKPKVTFL